MSGFLVLKTRSPAIIAALLLIISTPARSGALDANQLQIIKETALTICNSVKEAKGYKTSMQIQGDVGAKLNGLVGKLVGGGVDAKGTLSKDEFEGLTQDATAIALQADQGCRERLFNKMFDKLSLNEDKVISNVAFQGAGFWVDNTNFDDVNGAVSTIMFKVDGQQVGITHLDRAFDGFDLQLSQGHHVITYIANVQSSDHYSKMNQSCSYGFTVKRDETYLVKISFAKMEDGRGVISSCGLSKA